MLKRPKLMTNNTSSINKEIKANGQKLETVTAFKYLSLFVPDKGSKPEILCTIEQMTVSTDKVETSLE